MSKGIIRNIGTKSNPLTFVHNAPPTAKEKISVQNKDFLLLAYARMPATRPSNNHITNITSAKAILL